MVLALVNEWSVETTFLPMILKMGYDYTKGSSEPEFQEVKYEMSSLVGVDQLCIR